MLKWIIWRVLFCSIKINYKTALWKSNKKWHLGPLIYHVLFVPSGSLMVAQKAHLSDFLWSYPSGLGSSRLSLVPTRFASFSVPALEDGVTSTAVWVRTWALKGSHQREINNGLCLAFLGIPDSPQNYVCCCLEPESTDGLWSKILFSGVILF